MLVRTGPPIATTFRTKKLVYAAALALLWSCTPNGPSQPGMQEPERQRIIVEFALPDEAGDNPSGPVQKQAVRILARLGPEIRKTSRTFEFLPMIAMDADAATIMKLLRMPEVRSIQPDREMKTFGSSGTAAPASAPRAKTP